MKAELQKRQKQTPSAPQPTNKEPTAQAARAWWMPDDRPAPAKKAQVTKPAAQTLNARVVKEMQRIVKESK
jgi:hypothetical protein